MFSWMRSNDAAISRYLKKIPPHLYAAAKQELLKSAANVHSDVSDNATTKLHVRTGALKRSLRFNSRGSELNTLVSWVRAGSSSTAHDVPYAHIQEYGGTIRAKRAYRGVQGGAYLNIPLPANKTGAGVTRQTAKQVFRNGGRIIKSRRGNYLVVSKIGVPLFVLKKSVKIPPRLGMRKAAKDEAPRLLNRLRDAMDGVIS